MVQTRTGGSGGMLIQLTQAGAVVQTAGLVGLAATPYRKTSAFVLTAPMISDILLAKPGFAKWLSMGFKTPANTPAAMTIATRLTLMIREAQRNQVKVVR